jgi:uncharacterized repeat protein (TIGR03803 family)
MKPTPAISTKPMKSSIKNLFLRPGGAARAGWLLSVLIAGLGLIPSGRVAAQNFTNLHSFDFGDGAMPYAGLVLSGTNFYGTTSEGGDGNQGFFVGTGSVFKASANGAVVTDLQGFTPLRSSTNSGGAFPKAGLILSGNTLYGTASAGTTSSNGAVFAVNIDGTGFTNLHNFLGYPNNDGAEPEAGLILSGTNLYGTTEIGGTFNQGTVFKGGTNGGGFMTLYNFTGGSDGANPVAGLILSGTNLYGTAEGGGSSGHGAVFAVSTNGAGFTNLHNFTGSDGSFPAAGLVLSGATLYGTTTAGGSGGNGTVFMVNTKGNGFATLHNFTATNNTGSNSDGAMPFAGLILSGNTLYGTASAGGIGGNGTVFQINTNGMGFTILYSFTALNSDFTNSDGAMPYAGLILSSNTLYGTASAGGSSDYGTIFSILAPPQLAIILSGTKVVLTWTNPAPGYVLQSTTNLSPASWGTNLPAPVVINGQNTVTNSISGTQQFYRLGP